MAKNTRQQEKGCFPEMGECPRERQGGMVTPLML